MVYVISKNGKPLMPTQRHGKVKWLLKTGKAKVVQRTPFTIQLLYDSEEYIQDINLGIDAGSKTIGVSATTDKKELYSAEVLLRQDVSKNILARAQFRRNRRNRKTRYRPVRFLNRVKSKHKDWLAPSIKQKINSHISVIKKVYKILPIKNLIVETASFDIQKINNPDISGKEYQEGQQLGFSNHKAFVLFRDGYKCQHCKGKSKDNKLNVHHIIYRSQNGSDKPDNLITLCECCHKKVHSGEIKLKTDKSKQFKDEAFMGIMRKTLLFRLSALFDNVTETYGYITKENRQSLGLPKEHRHDAFCISGNLSAKLNDEWFLQKCVRTRNRQLHKATINKGGIRKNNQADKYVFGFQLFDKVLYNGVECFVFGRRSRGCFDIRLLDGTNIHKSINYKKLKIIEKTKSILTERKARGEIHLRI